MLNVSCVRTASRLDLMSEVMNVARFGSDRAMHPDSNLAEVMKLPYESSVPITIWPVRLSD